RNFTPSRLRMSATTAAAFMRCLLLPTSAWAWGIVCTHEPPIQRARALSVPRDRRTRDGSAHDARADGCGADSYAAGPGIYRSGRRRGTARKVHERPDPGRARVDRRPAEPRVGEL